MMKAFHAIMKYSLADMTRSGLGDSDFRVLELLLHKGPMPVNTLGPKVGLTPGAISIAVDRLFDRELVSRTESSEDRRVRIVSLTDSGRKLIEPLFACHAAAMARVFSDFSEKDLHTFESYLKTAGRHAEELMKDRP